MSSALSIRQLTKTYGNGFQALSGIDLDVAEGDFFALLGPNGAGKSTTIGILSTLVNKTSGTVNIFGHDLDTNPAALKRSIGVTVAFASTGVLLGLLSGSQSIVFDGLFSVIDTLVLMLALGTLTRYSGTDTTLGLAFANTGVLYPFFGTLMGWLGVALTGSDTASNVLFGGMQKVAADQLGLSPNLMGAANSSGGVMGKMIDAQSIVVASTATRWFNKEGEILRYVFFHSIALACLVGLYVTMQAYVWPFTLMVVK